MYGKKVEVRESTGKCFACHSRLERVVRSKPGDKMRVRDDKTKTVVKKDKVKTPPRYYNRKTIIRAA